ncbi:MAG TPA: DUF72 domain-containing protein [Gammaproteobacteria bacterium]|nr:DUF72 domain-containing protein [Gammaproteobacteria bacterium]
MTQFYVGISGWTYTTWRGTFYPRSLPQARQLAYCCNRFNSLEINGSFYALQRPDSYRAWYQQAPAGFVFAVKGSRFITHMKKLRDIELPLANFFASGVLRLADKLGPVLWQFPANFAFNAARLAHFLELLPTTARAAAELAQRHGAAVAGRAWTEAEYEGPLRHAFEVRHPSFLCAEFIDLLRHHGAALAFADSAGRWPYAEDVTGDFVYVRLHGAEELYASQYSDAQLDWWAQRCRIWAAGGEPADACRISQQRPTARHREVFVYFDNDAKVHAPFDAARLAQRLLP